MCERKCIFRNRKYKVGDLVTPRDGETIPRHFVPVESVLAPEEVPAEPKTLKELQDNRVKAPKTGMAAQPVNPATSAADVPAVAPETEDPFA